MRYSAPPDLLSYLQGIIDDDPVPGRWILSGSQNLSLLQSVSQSLAGRTDVYHLLPLTRGEITRFDEPPATLEATLFAGGYPRIFDRQLAPSDWLRSYVATYLERGRANAQQHRRPGDVSALRRVVRRANRAVAQLLVAGRRLRHIAAQRQGMARGAGGQLHRLSPAGVSRQHAQATREDAEALFFTIPAWSAGSWASVSRSNCAHIRFAGRSSRPGSSRKS